ncbi:hypothetical protein NGO_0686 [Neisseria gonorrhoeae FA 1090]|uniref:Uncharacterized protein n=1 Tax=Neisseria gonorrhoeae (strain ATCC 700825 / FA 1090) TaxID=242231 RepID=Q5F8S4_NEIG1|nr:hypothetical protein NGO_0686 [Neisseria gonorrhoeae FA 1090]
MRKKIKKWIYATNGIIMSIWIIFFQILALCMTVAEQPFSMKTILFILFSA